MPRPIIAKDDFLTGSTSYVKFGKDFYVMKKVKGVTDPSEEAKEMYKKQYDKASRELKNVVATNVASDWTTQIRKLQETKQDTNISIPINRYNKAVMYRDSDRRMLDIKAGMYHPVEILTTLRWLRDNRLTGTLNAVQQSLLAGFEPTEQIVVTVKNDFYFPFLIGLDDRNKRILTIGISTFHTFPGGELCIGNSRYEDYKSLNDKNLSEQISRTNTFSPAQGSLKFGGVEITYAMLINANTLVSARKKDGVAWTT